MAFRLAKLRFGYKMNPVPVFFQAGFTTVQVRTHTRNG